MNALVTGGAGFIGSHVVEGLVSAGHQVRVLDDLSTGRWSNLDSVRGDVECLEGSVADPAVAARAVRGVEVILHHAAFPSVARSVSDPVATNTANVTGTLTVLGAARAAGVRRVVYAGSSAVYGLDPELPKVESMPARPNSPYGVSKLAGELYCSVFTGLFGLETVCLRYFNVFGPRQDAEPSYGTVVPRFLRALCAGEPVPLEGDGSQTRDFVFVANVVQANLQAMTAEGVSGGVFNIASGQRISLNILLESLVDILGVPARVEHRPARPGDVWHSLADISRARASLGYSPNVGLREGLRETAAWMRQQKQPL